MSLPCPAATTRWKHKIVAMTTVFVNNPMITTLLNKTFKRIVRRYANTEQSRCKHVSRYESFINESLAIPFHINVVIKRFKNISFSILKSIPHFYFYYTVSSLVQNVSIVVVNKIPPRSSDQRLTNEQSKSRPILRLYQARFMKQWTSHESESQTSTKTRFDIFNFPFVVLYKSRIFYVDMPPLLLVDKWV